MRINRFFRELRRRTVTILPTTQGPPAERSGREVVPRRRTTTILLLPGAERGPRADLLCDDCGERMRYPDGEWGEVVCGCPEPPGWVVR